MPHQLNKMLIEVEFLATEVELLATEVETWLSLPSTSHLSLDVLVVAARSSVASSRDLASSIWLAVDSGHRSPYDAGSLNRMRTVYANLEQLRFRFEMSLGHLGANE